MPASPASIRPNRALPLALIGALFVLSPQAFAQVAVGVAPSPQNNGFAIADQIRAGRTSSLTYAQAFQQKQQNDALIAAQQAQADAVAQLAAQQAEEAAKPSFAVTPDGGFAMRGPVFGSGLVAPVGGQITNNINLQITLQNGDGNTSVNSSTANAANSAR